MDYLAVRLQEVESYLFIDQVLPHVFADAIKVVSKHDSLLCKASDALAVRAQMQQILNAYLGEGKYALKESNLCADSEVRLLRESFNKTGYEFQIEMRTANAALYAQLDEHGVVKAYEVFKVLKRPPAEFNGQQYPEREKYPADSDFGRTAWNVTDKGKATRLMLELEIFGRRLRPNDPHVMTMIVQNLLEQ